MVWIKYVNQIGLLGVLARLSLSCTPAQYFRIFTSLQSWFTNITLLFIYLLPRQYIIALFPRYILRRVQNRYIWLQLLLLNPDGGRGWYILHDGQRMATTQQQRMASVQNGVETLPKISTGWGGSRTWQTTDDRRQTDLRFAIAKQIS